MGRRRSHKLSLIFRRKLWPNLPQASQEKQSKRNRARFKIESRAHHTGGDSQDRVAVGFCPHCRWFSKFANLSHNIASLIVRDHVRTLGETMEEFPQKRLTELIESLSNEISHSELIT